MKKTILIYGLILGSIISINMVYMVNLCYTNPGFEPSEVLGYAAMIVVFSMMYVGIRNYRNKQLDGYISFGQAFKMGAIIALIGSTCYVGVWLIYYYLFVPDFIDVYSTHVLKVATSAGASSAELANKAAEMEQFKEMYKSPFFVVLISYTEILPVGILVSLVSALVLKKKKAEGVLTTENG